MDIEENVYEDETTEEDLDDFDVVSYLYYVCDYIKEVDFEEIPIDEVVDSLKEMEDELGKMLSLYKKDAPYGVKSIREYMLEIIYNLQKAVDVFLQYLKSAQKEYIEEGDKKIKKAELMIDDLRQTIAQQRLEISELMSKIQRGLIKEGEPIKEDESISYLITE